MIIAADATSLPPPPQLGHPYSARARATQGLSEMAIEAWTKAEKETDTLHTITTNATG